MNRILTAIIAFVFAANVNAQGTFPFDISLEPVTISGLPGMQSYTAGESGGKWLIIGGRLDGLHQRQPWQSFDAAGHNNNMYVVDPVAGQYWSAPLSGLTNADLRAQLAATNANYHQEGDLLYMIGGYGLDANTVHITHPMMTVIDVPTMISSIVNDTLVDPTAIQTMSGDYYAVTGGRLMYLDSTFYLVGGQRFDGQYNPMGHNTYVQTYTEAVRRFELSGTFPNLSVDTLASWVDTAQLHRRDYNVTYMMDSLHTYITAWSGVFQKAADLPFLNAVEVHDTGYAVVPNFSQYLNHYHCAHTSLYAEHLDAMYTVFFGGIAQYYYDASGNLVQDDNVPFVKTIGITEKRNGNYSEGYSTTAMPGYLGAGAEFFHANDLSSNGEIFLADDISDSAVVGYIFGGINSPAANVFFGGQTNTSTATSNIYKVVLTRNSGIGVVETPSAPKLGLQVNPNPANGRLVAQVVSPLQGWAAFDILDTTGRLVLRTEIPVKTGTNTADLGTLELAKGQYFLRAQIGGVQQQIKFFWN